jgi:hypothetical protein
MLGTRACQLSLNGDKGVTATFTKSRDNPTAVDRHGN